MVVEPCTATDQPGWLDLRSALWPHSSQDEHLSEMASLLADPARYAQFIAYSAPGRAAGFIEASIRSDYVNGTTSSPVAFLEGMYVIPAARRQGIAAALVATVTDWAITTGCQELASDALLDNDLSHTVHRALGFQETERVVYFRKSLLEA